MNGIEILMGILSIIIGYLLGSILPAYLFGKLKGIDIREEGTKNAGTANAFRVLGLPYAIPTALYDTLKGLLAILIASYVMTGSPPELAFIFMQISGLFAIVGHVFPFYLKFRGGQGNATATGLLLFYLVNYINAGPEIFYVLIFLMILVAIFTYISKAGSLLPVLLFPLLGYSVFINYPESPFNIFFCIVLLHIATIGMYKVITEKKLVITDEEFLSRWWRVAIRPVALLFLLFYFIFSQAVAVALSGIVCLCFIALDISRFLSKQTQELLTVKVKSIFRKGEEKKFSSMTIFLISTFIVILIFEIEIAITALVFLTFGDMYSKIFGLAYGRHKLFDKTIEGTLAYIGCVITCGYIIFTAMDISLIVLIIGGIAATFSEFFPLGMNDNFTVPIISSAAMFLAVFFGL
ncbi:MAG: glycerol-3-phosphate acyltransferase [Promethearchaeota archaeon]|nr:MAG: glycerol-3-phosphate acyltransferase [Candidatus Lokiarchaeota archaeon]